MNRRAILAVLGATTSGIAGCLDELSTDPDAGTGTGDDPDDGSDGAEDDANGTDGGNGADGANGGNGADGTDGAGGAVRDHFDTDPDRPECEVESETIELDRGDEPREVETAETIPYPDPPTSFAEDDVLEYVEAFDHAYVTHDVLCDRRGSGAILTIAYGVEDRESFDWDDDVAIVFLRRAAGATWGIDEDGYEWQADLGFSAVVYAVDETGVARAAFDDASELEDGELESNAPDPRSEGTLVELFE